MQDVWRLFAAIEITPEIEERVSAIARRLEEAGWRARWVDPAGSHLTVKFFGNVPVPQVERLEQALYEAASDQTSFTLRVGSLGVFPNTRRPRVVWLGLIGQTEPVHDLFDLVELNITQAGFEAESRPFHPHITVGRIRPEHQSSLGHVDEQLEELSRLPSLALPVDHLTLFRSELTRGRPIYTAVRRFSLKDDPA